jgi:hypothetical protein
MWGVALSFQVQTQFFGYFSAAQPIYVASP